MDRQFIKSKHVVVPGGILPAVLVIAGNKIEDIITDINFNPPHIQDLGEAYIMPGIIDPHVHINEPGRTDWEGFETATRAALAGGITTLVEMPLNASPVTTTTAAFSTKLSATSNKLQVNCGFWGGVVPGNEHEIQPLIEQGVLGFKAFLTHSGIDEFPNVTEADLKKAMPIIASANLPLLIHCELSTEDASLKSKDPSSYQEYLSSRPKTWEDKAIALMIRLCETYNCRTHIVHLSSADAIGQIRKAKEKGLPITVETAHHYLFFSAEEIKDGQTVFKCAPPIREKANNDLLWRALKEGVIDFVATDHSPAPPNLKELLSGNFSTAWGGISSLQWSLPVLWTAAQQRGFTVSDISKWLCENPSRLLPGSYKKGKIEKGYDADLISWNPHEAFTILEKDVQHRHKISPYINQQLNGCVKKVWLEGIKIFDQQQTLFNRGKVLLRSEKKLLHH